jgi:hypothetical protein
MLLELGREEAKVACLAPKDHPRHVVDKNVGGVRWCSVVFGGVRWGIEGGECRSRQGARTVLNSTIWPEGGSGPGYTKCSANWTFGRYITLMDVVLLENFGGIV